MTHNICQTRDHRLSKNENLGHAIGFFKLDLQTQQQQAPKKDPSPPYIPVIGAAPKGRSWTDLGVCGGGLSAAFTIVLVFFRPLTPRRPRPAPRSVPPGTRHRLHPRQVRPGKDLHRHRVPRVLADGRPPPRDHAAHADNPAGPLPQADAPGLHLQPAAGVPDVLADREALRGRDDAGEDRLLRGAGGTGVVGAGLQHGDDGAPGGRDGRRLERVRLAGVFVRDSFRLYF